MSEILRNKRLVVGVCAGIAAFKAVALVSQLQKAGAVVDVIMTERASEFVSALSFSSLSHRPVYSDLWEQTGQAAARHIELGREADLLVVVPATANTIAKLAHGLADTMLGAVALATTAPLLIAPAMEQAMYRHPATQANLCHAARARRADCRARGGYAGFGRSGRGTPARARDADAGDCPGAGARRPAGRAARGGDGWRHAGANRPGAFYWEPIIGADGLRAGRGGA